MIDGARRCSFRRDDGTRVVGLVMPGSAQCCDDIETVALVGALHCIE